MNIEGKRLSKNRFLQDVGLETNAENPMDYTKDKQVNGRKTEEASKGERLCE